MFAVVTRIRSVERSICRIAAVCTVLFYCPDVRPHIYLGRDLDLEDTWRWPSVDHTIRYIQFPIRALLELTQIWSPYVGTVENQGKKRWKTRHTLVKIAKITAKSRPFIQMLIC